MSGRDAVELGEDGALVLVRARLRQDVLRSLAARRRSRRYRYRSIARRAHVF